jgi:methylmalonyl-CoA mutase
MANAIALEDVSGGVDGLVLAFANAPAARGFGVTPDDVETILSGVDLDEIALRLDPAPFLGRAASDVVAALVSRRRVDPAEVAVDFGMDPIGDMARTGTFDPKGISDAVTLTRHLRHVGFSSPILRADGRVYHDAGATEAQEIAAVLATAVSYLRLLENAGIALETARDALSFLLVPDADEFLTIAKFRSLRYLWSIIEEASGLEPRPTRISAETSYRMTTRTDAHVNLLRNTMATFSAAIGGADGVTVLPHTTPLGLADSFARRLARNTQMILIEESNLWRVSDPAGGAGGFEALTHALSSKAWEIFQSIEKSGGLSAMLRSGEWQAAIARSRDAISQAVARRQRPLTGTTEFPLLGEQVPTVLQPLPLSAPDSPETSFPALRPGRLSEPFEQLCALGESLNASVFLVTIGRPADFSVRAGFAKALFEAGGIRAIGGEESLQTVEITAAFQASGAQVACLCSSDGLYDSPASDNLENVDTLAQDAARRLTAAGCRFIARAGRPSVHEVQDRARGIHGFVFSGVDAVEFLRQVFEKIRDTA